MTERIDREGFSTPAFDEDETTTPLFDAPPKEALAEAAQKGRALYQDAVDLGRSVYGKVKEVQAAVDLESNIEQLGPGDSIKLRASGQLSVGVSGSMAEGFEVKRGVDGRYTVSGSAELSLGLKEKLELGSKLLQSVGLEQGGAARVELSCGSAEEAAQAARALRNLQLRQMNIPIGDPSEDLKVLAKTASAIELGTRIGGHVDAGLSILGSDLELRGAVKADTAVRYELRKNELVFKSVLTTEGGAPLKLKGLVPQASSSSLGLGQALKGGVKVETETRVKLEGDLGAALAAAKSKVTLSGEARASAVATSAGREARVSLEVDAQQAKAVLEAVATQDAAKLAPMLEAKVSVEARRFEEKGGDLNFGLSGGAVGGFVALEAKLRDVDEGAVVTADATLGEALAWITSY